MGNKEIKSLTGIRGIAALYVAIYHFFQSSNDLHFYSSWINHGYLAVDLFFILSGYLLTMTSRSKFESNLTWEQYLQFMKKRFARIYPLFFLVLTFIFIFMTKGTAIIQYCTSVALLSIFWPHNSLLGAIWSLSAEWQMYLFFPFLIWSLQRMKKPSEINIVCTFLAVLGILLVYSRPVLSSKAHLFDLDAGELGLMRCLISYLLGISCFYVSIQIKMWDRRLLEFFSVGIVLAIVLSLSFNKLDGIAILLFSILVLLLSRNDLLLSRMCGSWVCYQLGLISYSLYLIHDLLLHYEATIYNPFSNQPMLYASIQLGYAIILSIVTYRYLELPLTNWVRKKIQA